MTEMLTRVSRSLGCVFIVRVLDFVEGEELPLGPNAKHSGCERVALGKP